MKVLIYEDWGTSSKSLKESFEWFFGKERVQAVSAKMIREGALRNPRVGVFALPGGQSDLWSNPLGALGNNEIVDFANRGLVVAVCGGGYYLCNRYKFEDKAIRQGLGIFPGEATGVMEEFKKKGTNIYTGIANLETTEGLKKALYLAGPEFKLPGKEKWQAGEEFEVNGQKIKVYATYRDSARHSPAAFSITSGNGKILIISTHLEDDFFTLYRQHPNVTSRACDHSIRENLKHLLASHDVGELRRDYFQNLLADFTGMPPYYHGLYKKIASHPPFFKKPKFGASENLERN